MVRTKADTTAVKVSGAKAPRKTVSTPTRSVSDSSDGKSKASGGGNAYHPRETPGWQKPITTFFGSPFKSLESSETSKDQSTSDNTSTEAADS